MYLSDNAAINLLHLYETILHIDCSFASSSPLVLKETYNRFISTILYTLPLFAHKGKIKRK